MKSKLSQIGGIITGWGFGILFLGIIFIYAMYELFIISWNKLFGGKLEGNRS